MTWGPLALAERVTRGVATNTALAMVFKLAKSAEHHWRKLDGANRLENAPARAPYPSIDHHSAVPEPQPPATAESLML